MAKIETNIPGDFSEVEEAILKYIYEHPDWDTGTFALAKVLKPLPAPDESSTAEVNQQHELQAFKEIQYAVETLYLAKCVKGTRQRTFSGEIYFSELKLTTAGEAAAIKEKRRIKKVVIDQSNRPDWSKMHKDAQ